MTLMSAESGTGVRVFTDARSRQRAEAETLVELLGEGLPLAAWPVSDSHRTKALVSGHVFRWAHPNGDPHGGLVRDEVAAVLALREWAYLFPGPIQFRKRSDGTYRLTVRGVFHGIPVEVWTVVAAPPADAVEEPP